MLKIDHPQVYIYSYQLSSDSKTEVDSIWTWVNNLWQHFSPDKSLVFSQANLSYPLTKPNKLTHSNQDECLKHLFPEASVRPPFYRATELFDSPMFEYSSPKSQVQVFVYLVDDDIEGKLGKIVEPLFELFYYRHKITKAFIDSRRNYDLLKERWS